MITVGAILGHMLEDVRVNDRLTIPAAELSWRFSHVSGPGGRGVGAIDAKGRLSVRRTSWPM